MLLCWPHGWVWDECRATCWPRIAIGFVPGVGSDTQELQNIPKFGVIAMLFFLGMKHESQALRNIRARLIAIDGLQI